MIALRDQEHGSFGFIFRLYRAALSKLFGITTGSFTRAARGESLSSISSSDRKRITLIRHGQSEYNHWRASTFRNFQIKEWFRQDPGTNISLCLAGVCVNTGRV